jgi:hypothetical protein
MTKWKSTGKRAPFDFVNLKNKKTKQEEEEEERTGIKG